MRLRVLSWLLLLFLVTPLSAAETASNAQKFRAQLAGAIREVKYSPWRKCSTTLLRCLSERGTYNGKRNSSCHGHSSRLYVELFENGRALRNTAFTTLTHCCKVGRIYATRGTIMQTVSS
jgi:hypothetical protein